MESLAAQLKGYQGVGPEAVAALQREHAALLADKVRQPCVWGMLETWAKEGQLDDKLKCISACLIRLWFRYYSPIEGPRRSYTRS